MTTVVSRGTCESENTQPTELRFSALLTDDGDPRVQLHRA
jgi:hypothetical protein